jgi:hypothetical protein
MSMSVLAKRAPGSLAERFWSIARAAAPSEEEGTRDPQVVVRDVLRILDLLSAGEVGDGVSQSTVSFLQLLRQQEQAGDLSYASPEQARGEALDERSLVFSVGVLLFEELTGRHPFGAMASGRRFARIQKCEMGSGVQYFPQVPGDLRSVLMRAMGPFPEERFRSLRELRGELERFANPPPPAATPPAEAATRIRRPLKGLPPTPADLAFASVEEEMPTRLHKRADLEREPAAPPAPPIAASPAAPMPSPLRGKPSLQVTMLATAAAPNDTDKLPALYEEGGLKKQHPVLERLGYVVVGALVAAVVTIVALRSKSAPAPLPAAIAAPARNVEPPASIATATKSSAVAAPTSGFDVALASQNAAKALHGCFAEARAQADVVTFGAGILWNKGGAGSARVFLAPPSDDPLTPEERRCMAHALVGISGGAAPNKAVLIDYTFRLKQNGVIDAKGVPQK